MSSSLASNNCNQTLSLKSSYVGGFIVLHILVYKNRRFLSLRSNLFTQHGSCYMMCLVQLGEPKTLYNMVAHIGLNFTSSLLVATYAKL